MGLFDFLNQIFSQGYGSIEEYCNEKGCNICDVVDDPEQEKSFFDDDDD